MTLLWPRESRRVPWFVFITSALLTTGPYLAAQAPISTSHQTLQITTRVVQVDVVVHDPQGNPVPGLKREDFTLFDNGKPQDIRYFSVEEGGTLPPRVIPLPTNTFTNRLEGPAGFPTSATIILLDGLNTGFADVAYARNQVLNFLSQLRPGDRVALYALNPRLTVLQDFTSDVAPLILAIRRLQGKERALTPEQAPQVDRLPAHAAELQASLNRIFAQMNAGLERQRVLITLEALEAIANHVAQIPGRKNLVWVSASFPDVYGFDRWMPDQFSMAYRDEIEAVIRDLNSAHLAVYPLDARGLFASPYLDVSNRQFSATPDQFSSAISGNQANTLSAMGNWAGRTGGRLFANTNDFQSAIRSAANDERLVYTLGFSPTSARWDGDFHSLKVQANQPKAELLYRQGYFAMGEPKELSEKQKAQMLRDAFASPLAPAGLALTVALESREFALDNRLGLRIRLDPRQVTYTMRDSRWASEIDCYVQQVSAKGKILETVQQEVFLRLKDPTFQQAQKEGLIVPMRIGLKKGVTELRIAVRDSGSGSIGILAIPMDKVR